MSPSIVWARCQGATFLFHHRAIPLAGPSKWKLTLDLPSWELGLGQVSRSKRCSLISRSQACPTQFCCAIPSPHVTKGDDRSFIDGLVYWDESINWPLYTQPWNSSGDLKIFGWWHLCPMLAHLSQRLKFYCSANLPHDFHEVLLKKVYTSKSPASLPGRTQQRSPTYLPTPHNFIRPEA